MKALRRSALLLTVALLGVIPIAAPASASLPPGGTFIDDDLNFHEGYIEALAAEGITNGCDSEGPLYCPDRDVKRSEVAALISRTLGLTDTGGIDWFNDDDGTWYEQDANRLAAAGISNGCGGGAFCGDDILTRAELAAFWVRAWNYTDPGPGDFFTDDDGTWFEPFVDRLAQAGVTTGCAEGLYCPYDPVKRDQAATFVGRAEGFTPTVPPPAQPDIQTIASGLNRPVFLTSPPGDDRQFIVEKGGRILIMQDDAILPTPFLDASGLVSTGNEQGLLSMAFHPDYASNGRVFISYTDTAGDTRIREYRRSGANPNIANGGFAVEIIEVDQPSQYTNHNGGLIAFDPNGYLLIGLGDGGGGGDPLEQAQNTNTLLGALLRIDVDGDDFPGDDSRTYAIPSDNPFVGTAGADEIWAYGLRNPWRWSVDPATNLLYLADVGQREREEVNIVPVSTGGLNYGWDDTEGTLCYEPSSGCTTAGTTFPEFEYAHGGGGAITGCSITGGYVYRGDDFPIYRGHYFFADYCRGNLLSLAYSPSGGVTDVRNWSAEFGFLGNVNSFGLDAQDRLYILTDDGRIHRLIRGS